MAPLHSLVDGLNNEKQVSPKGRYHFKASIPYVHIQASFSYLSLSGVTPIGEHYIIVFRWHHIHFPSM